MSNVEAFNCIGESRLHDILQRMRNARVAVIGDFCLDSYWFTDLSQSETSIETGLATRPVQQQRYTLGGAGNVVSNLLALGCGSVFVLGVVGDDPWGREMRRLLETPRVKADGLLIQADSWATLAYNKPYIEGAESHRFDFGNFNRLSSATADALVDQCRAILPRVDMVVVNQQVRQGIHCEPFRGELVKMIQAADAPPSIVDSRHHSESFQGAHLKINDLEAATLCGLHDQAGNGVSRTLVSEAAVTLQRRMRRPVYITRGSRGIVVADDRKVTEVPGVQVIGDVDTVGAGDSALAGIALALATGAEAAEAAHVGNLVAGVTIQKLHQTGTASPQEVHALAHEYPYVFHPELADDPRQGRFRPGTEIEIIRDRPASVPIQHAVFDHDGTLSVLREGWETVMEPMMVRAILGPAHDTAEDSLYRHVVQRVRRFIDETTGIQTLAQMQGLVELVREFGSVSAGEVLDEFAYKAIYNDALMDRVRGRMAKLARGELSVDDLVIKNAFALLQRLHAAGLRLYLASGTDQEDVIAEADALGYAHLFEGRIYGAVGDVRKEAKRMVIERILADVGDSAVDSMVTFGDGPVEIRETRRRGGYAVGIASDEVRRYGLNRSKRSRLIRAGADLIVADYSELDRLLAELGLNTA